MINFELPFTLTWFENSVITTRVYRKTFVGTATNKNPRYPEVNSPSKSTFQLNDTKLYVIVVTLSTEDDNKFLEQLKTGFKRNIKWNKYRSEMTIFNKVNRLFALSFKNEDDSTSFSKYCTPKVEMKDFNVLTDGKRFFDMTKKNKEKAYKKIIEISKNNNYTTGNWLDYEYFSKLFKLIAIDLSKQIELENLDLKKQINFISKLEEDEA